MVKLARMLRALVPVALLSFTCLTQPAALAASPPSMPLPPCTEVDGQRQGACPMQSEAVSGVGDGRFTAGGSVYVEVQPTVPVCDHWNKYSHVGAPFPCYNKVGSGSYGSAPQVMACATIDLQNNNRFREMSCGQALYKNPQGLPNPLFTSRRLAGFEDNFMRANCGAAPDYNTYAYGGAANDPEHVWRSRGPKALGCVLSFAPTERPDGLYGPTWVKIRVTIGHAESGDPATWGSESAEFYVPIDGDLRHEPIDVSAAASAALEGSGDQLNVVYTATLTNTGEGDAEDVTVTMRLPEQVHFEEVSSESCTHTSQFVGGTVTCSGLTVRGTGSATGSDVVQIDVKGRVTNAADLGEMLLKAAVPDDIDTSNNQDSATATPRLSGGSIAQTREAMRALDAYFVYQSDQREQGCNIYKEEIWLRLQQIRQEHPSVFENLAYGRVTSGEYFTEVGSAAGHVGVVVYPKGSDYHETGIIIHGTPSPSPLSLFNTAFDTQIGGNPLGQESNFARTHSTSSHGLLYRTPVVSFPGSPRPEKDGCGFEGVYSNNADEFERVESAGCSGQTEASWPAAPEAVTVTTESPVDLLLTNSRGQRVKTDGGTVSTLELGSSIHAMAFPHEDGSFGWTMVLPKDDYEVQLTGNGEGPYRLTMTRFDEAGERIDSVVEGITRPGQIDTYELDGAPEPGTPEPPTAADQGSKSGGGGFGLLGLLLLLIPALIRRIRGAHA